MSGINKIDERSENPANELMDAIYQQAQDLPVMPELQDPLKILERKKPFGQAEEQLPHRRIGESKEGQKQ